MRRVFCSLVFLFIFFSFVSNAYALDSDNDLLPEPTCLSYTASGEFKERKCNSPCARKCIESGLSCEFGKPYTCVNLQAENLWPEVSNTVKPAFNIFSVELCPDSSQRPPNDPYCSLTLVRLVFYAVISVSVLIIVIMAFWVVWERSTAEDKAEKIEKANNIAKNTIIGTIVTFLFIAIVQVVAMITGLTENLFEISIVPQPEIRGRWESCKIPGRYTVCDTGLVCKAITVPVPGGGMEVQYICDNP